MSADGWTIKDLAQFRELLVKAATPDFNMIMDEIGNEIRFREIKYEKLLKGETIEV
jgi:hypothetical protein